MFLDASCFQMQITRCIMLSNADYHVCRLSCMKIIRFAEYPGCRLFPSTKKFRIINFDNFMFEIIVFQAHFAGKRPWWKPIFVEDCPVCTFPCMRLIMSKILLSV